MSNARKRVLVLATDCDSTRIVYNALKEEFEICAVVLERPVPKKQMLQRRLKKLGLKTVLGQLAFRTLVVPALSAEGRQRIAEISRQYQLDRSPVAPGRVQRVESVNSDECRALLASYEPNLIIVNGTRILSTATLEAVQARFINIHVGVTPLYRGVHGGYWALVAGTPEEFGVTVHLVDAGIDTGSILKQGRIVPTRRDNFATYPYLQCAIGIPLLKEAVAELLSGHVQTLPPPSGPSRLWSHPTIGQYLNNRLLNNVR